MAALLDAWVKFSEEQGLQLAHPHVRDNNVFLNYATPYVPVACAVVYVFLVFTVPKLLSNAKPLQLTPVVAFWNLLLSLFSLVTLLGVGIPYYKVLWDNGFLDGFCGAGPGWVSLFDDKSGMLFWAFLFALSKYAELLDTLFLILRKKPVGFLHWYHHFTVLLYTWFAEYWHFALGFIFITVNAFVHTFMYFYYFLSEIGKKPPESVALFITIIQISQMVVGLFAIGTNLYIWSSTGIPCMCDRPTVMATAGILMYGSYLFLFVRFFLNRYVFAKPSSRSPKPGTPTGKPGSSKPTTKRPGTPKPKPHKE